MTAPDSNPPHQKAVDAVEGGERKSQVCRMLNLISRKTLDLRLKRQEKTGAVGAIREERRGHQPKIAESDVLPDLGEQQGYLTQQDMAQQ